MELEFTEKKIWRKNLRAALILIVISALAFALTRMWLAPRYDSLKEEIASTSSLVRQINATQAEADLAAEELASSGKVYGNLILDKDAYIEYLGGLAQENQLNINKMTVDDILSL